jgi:hypothetical protein
MATYASKLRPSAVDGQTIRVLPDGRIRGNAGMEPFSAGTKGGAPSVFYADGNVVSSGNGLSWLSATKTLSEALVMAHAYMSTSGNRAWAQRATVYCCADNFTEDITLFAEKTDVIGVGTTNQHPRPRIEGTHVLVAVGTDTFHGCRWFNVEWYGAAAGIIVDIPADQNGQEFHNCVWSAVDAATIGLRAVQSHDMTVKGCWFDPNTSGVGFSTAAIQINAGSVTNFLLEGCRIYSGSIGLDFNPTAGQPINCWAIKNNIYATGQTIDDESTGLLVAENNLISAAAEGTGSSWTFSTAKSVHNYSTGNDNTEEVPDPAS